MKNKTQKIIEAIDLGMMSYYMHVPVSQLPESKNKKRIEDFAKEVKKEAHRIIKEDN